MSIPTEINAGTTVEFSVTPRDRTTDDGYAYDFRLGAQTIIISNGVVNGDAVDFKLSPTDTANLTTGFYCYQIFAAKDGDRYLIAKGQIGVTASIGDSGAFDGRSTARRIVDAIDAVLEGRATSDQQSYSIQSGAGSRALSRIPVLELKQLREYYVSIVAGECRATNGTGIFRTHRVAFVCE